MHPIQVEHGIDLLHQTSRHYLVEIKRLKELPAGIGFDKSASQPPSRMRAPGWRTSGGPTHPDPSSPTPRLEPLGRNRVNSGDRREKWNAFGTLLSSRISAG
jgi:hypothetical protein